MSTEYQVRCLAVEEYRHWNELVKQSAQGTLFHTADWLKASGSPFRIYGCFKGGEMRGGLAIGINGRQTADHPPLTPYLGIVFRLAEGKYVTALSNDKEISLALARHVKNDFTSISCRFAPEVVDLQPFIWEGYASSVRYTYRLDVGDLDRVWTNMEPSRRKNIRGAEKDGIAIENGAGFSSVFSLVENTFERQGEKVAFKNAAFRYNEILSEGNRCRAFLARSNGGEELAAVYIVWDEKRAYYLLGGYDPQTSHHGAGALAMWEAIRFTRETLGLREFDFEGSMIPAIERFFRKFGGVLTPAYCVRWTKPSNRAFLSRATRQVARLLGGRNA